LEASSSFSLALPTPISLILSSSQVEIQDRHESYLKFKSSDYLCNRLLIFETGLIQQKIAFNKKNIEKK